MSRELTSSGIGTCVTKRVGFAGLPARAGAASAKVTAATAAAREAMRNARMQGIRSRDGTGRPLLIPKSTYWQMGDWVIDTMVETNAGPSKRLPGMRRTIVSWHGLTASRSDSLPAWYVSLGSATAAAHGTPCAAC